MAAPTQERIPTGARVKRYPALERYGFVWLWMGDPDAADEAQLIDIRTTTTRPGGRTKGGECRSACHYLYMVDNLLDPSHVAWVHLSSFAGAKDGFGAADGRCSAQRRVVTVWRG